MNKLERSAVQQASGQVQRRQWVTPAFERVALKEALTGTVNQAGIDGDTSSS